MPAVAELKSKVEWRVRNGLHSLALRFLDFERRLPSGNSIAVETYADWAIYNDIFVDQEYDFPINHVLKAVSPPGPARILDLGANVGFFSLRVAELLYRASVPGLDLSITLVEGSPNVHRTLSRRINAQISLKDKCRVIHGLVGRREGSATLHEIGYHGMNSLVPRRFSRQVEVPFVDLSQLCSAYPRLHLVKCDIEGSEQAFLESYGDLLDKTDAIVLEFHHPVIQYERCSQILRNAGLGQHRVLLKHDATSTEFFWR